MLTRALSCLFVSVALLATPATAQAGPSILSFFPDVVCIPGAFDFFYAAQPTQCCYLYYTFGTATSHVTYPGVAGYQRLDDPVFYGTVCGAGTIHIDVPDDFDGTYLFVQGVCVDLVTGNATFTAVAELLLLKVTITDTPLPYLPTNGNTVQHTATVRPASVNTFITFKLEDVSTFPGDAMNHGTQSATDPDYKIVAASNPTLTVAANQLSATTNNKVNMATLTTSSFDFGGLAKVKACVTILGHECCSPRKTIPRDTDGDTLPDAFEIAQGFDPNSTDSFFDGMNDGVRDDDHLRAVLANAGPPLLPMSQTIMGLTGDGLTSFEEYRGFFINNVHTRTSLNTKDVFVHVEASVPAAVGIGFYANLTGFAVHQILNTEWSGTGQRQINFNNAGIPGSTLQRALRVIDNPALTFLGLAVPLPPSLGNESPNESLRIEVAVLLHQRDTNGDDTIVGQTMTTGPDGIANTLAGGDDVQVIPLNRGQPNQICVRPPAGFGLLTAPGGDDVLVGVGNAARINTGPDGVCNTMAAIGDVQVIPVNRGAPNAVMITAGPNLVLDSLNGKAAGPDGIFCTADDVQVALTAAQKTDALRESVGHECGHGSHLEHNFCLGDQHLIAFQSGLPNSFCITTGPDGVCNSTAVGDDVQLIPVARGLPNSICIVDTLLNGIQSIVLGDDVIIGGVVTTGPDGICQSIALFDDAQIIPFGQGQPNANCISTGRDGVCNTARGGDDVQRIPLMQGEPNALAILSLGNGLQLLGGLGGDDVIMNPGMNVTTGPDGILQTLAAIAVPVAVSIITSDLLVPIPNTYTVDDLDQVRFHIKHP